MSQSVSNRSLETSQSLIAPLLREPVERYVLANGLTVLLKPDRSAAICSAQVWAKTGSIHEDEQLGAGLSHFVEHMLFKGTEKRQGREISETVQAAGGYINAYTTFDRTVYYIDVPSENVDVALDVLSDSVFNSTLPADEVEKEREVILREIDMGEDDPDSKLSHALFETAFRHHPYRYPIIGYKEVFKQISRETLVEYYQSRYAPNNVVLVVAGDFESAAIKESIESMFGGAKRKALKDIYLPEEPLQLASREAHLYEDVQITRVAFGFQVPGLTHEDTPVLDALSLILGNGNSSLLNLKLREDLRLAHTVDASNWTPGTVGVFYIAMICDPDKRDRAIAQMRDYIEGLDDAEITDDLVAKAVRQLLVTEINSRKTISGQASRLGSAEVVVGDIGYASNYLDRVTRITAKDVVRVLKEWLRWDRLTTITLNPKEAKAGSNAQESDAKSALDFEEASQENGSVLLLRENRRLPNLHFRLVLQAGALFEGAGKQGLTSLTATMLTKDTERREASEVSSAIESVGGTFYEFSGNNSLGLTMEVLPSDVDLALDLLEEAVLRPAFDEDTFELEKESHLAGIKEQLDDVVACGRRKLRELFFGAHPFCVGGAGSLDTVDSIGLEDLKRFWTKMRVAPNVVLAVSGDFDRATLLPKLESFLGKLPQGSLVSDDAVFEKPSSPGAHREEMDRQQAVVFHAYPGPGLKHEDFYVSEVADELFSGMSSQLFERVREELSLAYFVRSSRMIGLDIGMFYFCAGASPERYGEVIEELIREVNRVKAGQVSDEELLRCKTRLKASRRMSMQTNGACASQAAMNVAYGLPANDWRDYDARIDAVSIESLSSFAETYFAESQRVELVIGQV